MYILFTVTLSNWIKSNEYNLSIIIIIIVSFFGKKLNRQQTLTSWKIYQFFKSFCPRNLIEYFKEKKKKEKPLFLALQEYNYPMEGVGSYLSSLEVREAGSFPTL